MAEFLRCLAFASCLLLSITACCRGESSTCLMVYKEGGAPAVFQSPKCPRWKLSSFHSQSRTSKCQSAIHRGRRRYQEDRTVCALDVRIPFPGTTGITEVMVGVVAVLDGHNGAEASDMASKLLLEYLVLHTYFLLDSTFSSVLGKSIRGMLDNDDDHLYFRFVKDFERTEQFKGGRFKLTWPEIIDGSFRLEILKESLLRTIHDLDATFSKEASRYNFDSGSTATIILLVEGHILAANLGDSKALLCSEKYQPPSDAKATLLRLYRQKRAHGAVSRWKDCDNCQTVMSNGLTHLFVKELTRDHRPDRDDEKSRVELAGGYVLEWGGVARVNGELAVSRAIGDLSFKSYGVTSIPEVTDWQPLNANDSYLVAATDGVFEKLDSQDVCDLLWEVQNDNLAGSQLPSACSYSFADCIVNTAFDRGSTDNMAAVVVPLRSTGFLSNDKEKFFVQEEEASSGLVQLEQAHPIIAKFDRLLVEGNHESLGCFYLSENLKDYGDYTWVDVDEKQDHDLQNALPGAIDHCCGGSLNLYDNKDFCLYFGASSDAIRDHNIYPEGLAGFISLLESIPLHYSASDLGSFEHVKPDTRYILKKRFGRGAYGEVWLAFHWNCSHGIDQLKCTNKSKTSSGYCIHFDLFDHKSGMGSLRPDNDTGSPDDSSFILKRIMVEKGTAIYRSGLREKYFGEIFLNASTIQRLFLASYASNSFLNEPGSRVYDPLEMDRLSAEETENMGHSENIFLDANSTGEVIFEEGLNHIARYVESIESRSNEIWLVFRHEGISLTKLMYAAEELEGHSNEGHYERARYAQVLHPSEWWHWLKTTEAGQEEMRNFLWQLLLALKACHDRNITHRDIKPENMVICIEDPETGRCLKKAPSGVVERRSKVYASVDFTVTSSSFYWMRIIDFGSAIDQFTLKHLYGIIGPSRAEQTYEYTPPEGLLNTSWYKGPTSRIMKYDMWSVGVVMLELILGSPDVFQINPLSRALLDKHIEGWNEELKDLAYRLRSFMEMCILVPGSPTVKSFHDADTSSQGRGSPASWKCSEEFFSNLIKSRDPLKIGFPNVWAMRFVRQLLLWDPDDRLSVDDALRHRYFQQPP